MLHPLPAAGGPELAAALAAAALVAAVLGLLAGRAVRAVLGRMRRGVVVRAGPCETGVATAWVVPSVLAATGRLDPAWLPALAGLGLLAVAAGATDVLAGRLPNALTLPAALLAPVLVVPVGPAAVGAGVLGGLALGAAHALVHLAAPRALGAGDVKLALGLGVPLGAGSVPALLAVPVLAALALGVVAAVLRRRRVPFGPVLLGAAWLVVLATAVASAGAGTAA